MEKKLQAKQGLLQILRNQMPMEGNGAGGQTKHLKPRQSYGKQHEANQAARRGEPAQTSRAGEPSTIRHQGGQTAQSPWNENTEPTVNAQADS